MLEFLRSWQRERGRVIVFSGIFDPIHNGHMSVAKSALEHEASLIVFLPERQSYRTLKTDVKHRTKTGCSPYEQRLAMLKIATAKQPNFLVLESPYDHHTIKDTLSWIKTEFPKGQNFGLIFGADVAEHFWQWPNVESLSDYGVDLVIFADRETDSIFNIDRYKKSIPNVKVKTMRADNSHISSTLIRQNVKIRSDAMSEGVYDYILRNHLYDSDDSSAEK